MNTTARLAAPRGTHGRLGPLWTFFFRYGPPRWSRYVVDHWTGQRLVIAVPYLWLGIFFLIPFLIVLTISFAHESPLDRPPYDSPFQWVYLGEGALKEGALQIRLMVHGYVQLITDELYWSSMLFSLQVAAVSTLLCLCLGYPMAYAISRASPTSRNIFLMLVILPFWTSFLLRVYAWIGLLKNNGVINNVLLYLGVIHQPLALLQTDFAVYIGIVYSYLPFMILPLYANLEKHDPALLEAAADLGARPLRAFLRITLPQSLPGILAGSLLVFIPAVGEYVIPTLLGRTDQLMIGRVLSDEFFENRDWPVASAVAILILLLLVIPIMLFQRAQRRELEAGK